MDQNQALTLIDRLISQQRLTRQEHTQAQLAIQLLRSVAEAFSKMNREKKAAEEVAKKEEQPKNTAMPEAPKPALDNQDKSQA